MDHRKKPGTFSKVVFGLALVIILLLGKNNSAVNATNEVPHIISVSAGGNRTCALLSDGNARCWPLVYGPPPAGPFTQIDLGGVFSCGLRPSGSVECWDDTSAFAYFPQGIFQSIDVGEGAVHGCGIRPDQTVSCWGTNVFGRLNVPANITFSQISGNYYFSCGVKTDGQIACWDEKEGYTPNPLPTDLYQRISVGAYPGNYCGIKTDGTISCNEYPPMGQPPVGKFTKVELSESHACAINLDNTISCWGDNRYGQSTAPNGTFTDISVGMTHSCALRSDRRLFCWGGIMDKISSPLSFAPSDLSFALLNRYYDQAITITGGEIPYTFEVVSGNLPPGIEFTNGHFIGTPNVLGKFTVTILVTDLYGFTGKKTYTINVNVPAFLPIISRN